MADQITGTVCQDSLHWTGETESKSINSSFTCLHEPLKDSQYWAANAMFSPWNQWNTAPVRSEMLPDDERDTGRSVGRTVTVLAAALAVFAQGNKTLSSQSLRCWKHHSTKWPETKATTVQKEGGKPAVPGESQHWNRYCDKVRASPFDTCNTWEASVQPEWMSFEWTWRAGILELWLPEAMVMAKLGYCVARSYQRPVSTLQNRSALWGAIQHSEKFLIIKKKNIWKILNSFGNTAQRWVERNGEWDHEPRQ